MNPTLRYLSGWLASATAFALLAVPALAQHEAAGTLTVNGESVDIKYSYAAIYEGDITVVLSDSEIPREVLPDGTYDYAAAGNFKGVVISVSEETGEMMTGGWYELINAVHFHPVMNKQGDIGSPSYATTEQSEELLAGTVSTDGTKGVEGNEVSYDISFSVSLVQEPIEVTITGDDSEPAQAFGAWTRALFAGDVEGYLKYASREVVEMMPTDHAEIEEGLGFQQLMMPNNLEIESSEIDGDTAQLKVIGRRGMEESQGTVTMMREAGEWKVGEQSWESGDIE